MPKPILGYLDIRGLGEPIRLLLHYRKEDFEDKRYFTNDSWYDEKYKLNLDFPNLPYYIEGSVRLTQSTAILRYLARKFDLIGNTEEQKLRVAVAEQQIVDFRMTFIRFCYNPDYLKIKPEFLNNVPTDLKLFSQFLGDRKFLAGDSVTYVDFMAYETFEFYRLLLPRILSDFLNLKEYQDRIRKLPELQEYFQSPDYKPWPLVGSKASIAGQGTEPVPL